MSLLSASTVSQDPVAIAAALKRTPSVLYQSMFSQWSRAMKQIWQSASPQAVFTALGTDAKSLVTSSQLTATFLASVSATFNGGTANPADVANINAVVALAKTMTLNSDGTVTVTG